MNIDNCWYKKVCQEKCSESCIRFLEMQYLTENSGIPERKQIPIALQCENKDRQAFEHLRDIKDDILSFVQKGKNLYICSEETGNGKTSWSIKLLLKYFDSVWAGNGFQVRGLFIHTPTFLTELKNFNNPISEQYKEIVSNCDLVVWDDIASTKMSDYDASQLLIYIDTRTLKGLSNIYTGNVVTSKELENVLGNRLSSRIWFYSDVVEIKGKDRRGQ